MSKLLDGPMDEKDWQAHDDAHALRRAKEIAADPKRLEAATKMAEKLAKELEEEQKQMADVSELHDAMYPSMKKKEKEK
jgi:acyl-CoA thioesterase